MGRRRGVSWARRPTDLREEKNEIFLKKRFESNSRGSLRWEFPKEIRGLFAKRSGRV
jgi:hypothetical protein